MLKRYFWNIIKYTTRMSGESQDRYQSHTKGKKKHNQI